MRKEDVLAFVHRDWEAITAHKRRRSADQLSRMDPVEALMVGDELRRHVTVLREGWPTEEDRKGDLAAHIRLSESLRRVKPPIGR